MLKYKIEYLQFGNTIVNFKFIIYTKMLINTKYYFLRTKLLFKQK